MSTDHAHQTKTEQKLVEILFHMAYASAANTDRTNKRLKNVCQAAQTISESRRCLPVALERINQRIVMIQSTLTEKDVDDLENGRSGVPESTETPEQRLNSSDIVPETPTPSKTGKRKKTTNKETETRRVGWGVVDTVNERFKKSLGLQETETRGGLICLPPSKVRFPKEIVDSAVEHGLRAMDGFDLAEKKDPNYAIKRCRKIKCQAKDMRAFFGIRAAYNRLRLYIRSQAPNETIYLRKNI